MPVSVSLSIASQLLRVASLNLCTDEYLLLLARPDEIASLSRLASDRSDSVLWRRANGIAANGGNLESAISTRPTIVLTMGGGGKSSAEIASRMRLRSIDLPSPQSPADVALNMERVAAFLGHPERARPWLQRFHKLSANRQAQRDAILLNQGGYSTGPDSLAGKWMKFAGLRQRPLPGGRATLEMMTIHPPAVVLLSNYRRRQASLGQRWLAHPLARPAGSTLVETDGRPWTCTGPIMLDEIHRLKARL